MKSKLESTDLAGEVTMYGTEIQYLQVTGPVREVSSAPHSRSCSLKKKQRRPQDLDLKNVHRPRTNSLPSSSAQHRHRHGSGRGSASRESVNRAASSDKLCRVRSFKLTSKGVVNHGDCFKKMSTHSLMSTGSAASAELTMGETNSAGAISSAAKPRANSETSEASNSSGVVSGGSGSGSGSCSAPSYFRAALLGASGVGKSSLLRQFMTSEYRGTFDVVTPDAEETETTVSVLLDGEESKVEFIDDDKEQDLDSLQADAFVVVFSLADQDSYSAALDVLRRLRVDLGLDRPVLLVGNKLDLVRQRRVEEKEARLLSGKYDCHYEETSAALNHRVDELLVAVLSQIRHSLAPPSASDRDCQALLSVRTPLIHCCSPSPRKALSFFSRLFSGSGNKKTKSFDNLLVH